MSAGRRRRLLLGNGFSIAARQRFHYDELRLAADDAHGAGAVFAISRKLWLAANAYLAAAQRKFYFACKDARDSPFTVGHSLSKQDTHLTRLIGGGRIGRVFIGAFGGLNSPDGRRAANVSQNLERPSPLACQGLGQGSDEQADLDQGQQDHAGEDEGQAAAGQLDGVGTRAHGGLLWDGARFVTPPRASRGPPA